MDYDPHSVPALWAQWLRGAVKDPPTPEQQQADINRADLLAYRVRKRQSSTRTGSCTLQVSLDDSCFRLRVVCSIWLDCASWWCLCHTIVGHITKLPAASGSTGPVALHIRTNAGAVAVALVEWHAAASAHVC